MFQDCLLAYYCSLCQTMQEHVSKAVVYFDPDGIHDFRVEVKQLKAFFNLIETITPQFHAKKNLRNVRKIFKAMADLRDVHVQQELTRSWVKILGRYLTEYYNFLKQRELHARKTFAACSPTCDLPGELLKNERKLQRALSTLSDEYAAERTHIRIATLLTQIVEFGNAHKLQEAYLHKVRILAKETRYTIEIAQRCFPELGYRDELVDTLRKLHQVLGQWHDDEIALAHLNTFRDEFSVQYESEEAGYITSPAVYQKLTEHLLEEKNSLLHTYEERWENFVASVEKMTAHPA